MTREIHFKTRKQEEIERGIYKEHGNVLYEEAAARVLLLHVCP